jgi:hypothetical protein
MSGGGGRRKVRIVRSGRWRRAGADPYRNLRPVTMHALGFYLQLFVLLFCLASLALGVAIPLSVTANRWLVAVLALGCLLSRL